MWEVRNGRTGNREYVSGKSVIKSRKAYQLVVNGTDKGIYATLKEAKDAAEKLNRKE
jgi:hypothetical protein